ncbi:hypothetical protein MTR_1g057900 [Medicago truncatula]|uniref:Uncharacterized protein n=1 Tax=Medicago truncatula TaxID=3880 RepID=A0A072VV36_MEDTR|nr:hypothetical protein MTR_1g057900 [Medicago truncatula]
MLEKVKRKHDKKENMSGESQIVFDPMERRALTMGDKRIKSPCNCFGVMLIRGAMVLDSELTETGAGIAHN